MAVARQNEVQQRLGRIEKELEELQKNRLTAVPVSEYKAATAGTLPLIFTIIAVVGGSYYLLSERMTDLSERMAETTMQLNKRIDDVNLRIDDTNNLIRTVKSDLKEDIEDINEKLDRLLLK